MCAQSLIYSRLVCHFSSFYLFELYLPVVCMNVTVCWCCVHCATWFIHLSMIFFLFTDRFIYMSCLCAVTAHLLYSQLYLCFRTNKEFDDTIRLVAPKHHRHTFNELRVQFISCRYTYTDIHTAIEKNFEKVSDAVNCNMH